MLPLESLSSPLHHLCNTSITPSDVYEHLSQLDPTKVAGCDNIHPKILKFCATSLTEPVTDLFNLCLSQSNIPFEWKTHKIMPVPKKGDLSNSKNYRPISLQCILSKVLESIIYMKIIDFVRPQLLKNQHGFLKNRSYLIQLLLSYYKISCSLENKQSTNSTFLDFSKAFDSVPHDELLFKLWVIRITGPLWLWFRAYLMNRYHCVSLEGASSRCLPVLFSVPQVSVLGPLLFLIYINDLPQLVPHSTVYLFADHTKLISVSATPEDDNLLQTDLNSLQSWCSKWKLKVNANKCVGIHFTHSLPSCAPSLTINNTQIEFVFSHRDLGVAVTNNLSWSIHYNHICSKSSLP